MSIETLLQQAASHEQEGRLDVVETLLRQILCAAPTHREATLKLAEILIRAHRCDEAIGLLKPLDDDAHPDSAVLRRLGIAHAFTGRERLALGYFEKVLALEPDDAQVSQLVASLRQALDVEDESAATFRRALEANHLVRVPATVSPPDYRVLLVFAPCAGNTPFSYLIRDARFECTVLSALTDFDYDIESLRDSADVVVNLVCDADLGRAILGTVETLVERIGKPLLNPPRLIRQTGRAAVSERLASTPGCLVPQTRFFLQEALRQTLDEGGGADLRYPLLVRPAGTHGGDDFEKMEDRDQLVAFLAAHDQSSYYVIPFIDYRSADGYFRKYRFIYVGDEILPYHLAIDDKWKVHHATTPMVASRWMQDEERSFLADPWRVFGASQRAALQSIKDEFGLDYFGIDCSRMPDGAVAVFEVNASMLVHDRNEPFPYKNEAVSRIKQAFQALLERTALAERRGPGR